MFARDIMTKRVLTVKPDMSLRDLADFFVKNNISGAPVIDDDGSMIGIITEHDLIQQNVPLHIPTVISILDSFIYLESPKSFEREISRITATSVGELYKRKVVTVTENTSVSDVARLMETEGACHLIPVLDGGKIVGIIGKADIVKAMARE